MITQTSRFSVFTPDPSLLTESPWETGGILLTSCDERHTHKPPFSARLILHPGETRDATGKGPDMADRRGSARGGVATDAPAEFDLDDFEVVPEDEELSRAKVKPVVAQYGPLVDKALANLNKKLEMKRPVMVDGEVQYREDGSVVKEPVTRTKAEAEQFANDLRAAADRKKLPAQKRSLRIVHDPKLSEAADDTPIQTQFYAIALKGATSDNGQS